MRRETNDCRDQWVVDVLGEHDVSHARRLAADVAARLGFERAAGQRLATAVSELANNLVFHASAGGTVRILPLARPGQCGIEVVVEDGGPGIPDVAAAMTDGFSTNGGLGGGLPGSRRLMDDFVIESQPGRGDQSGDSAMAVMTGIARAAANAADLCGDLAASWSTDGRHVFTIADGLGHGSEAFTAAGQAIDYVSHNLGENLVALFAGMNQALWQTRGAAVGVAAFDPVVGCLTYAAVGNTRAAVFGWRVVRLDGFSGIVGGGYRRLAAQTTPFRAGDHLVMWTDGVDERLTFDPATSGFDATDCVARALLDRFATGGDDACVLVARLR